MIINKTRAAGETVDIMYVHLYKSFRCLAGLCAGEASSCSSGVDFWIWSPWRALNWIFFAFHRSLLHIFWRRVCAGAFGCFHTSRTEWCLRKNRYSHPYLKHGLSVYVSKPLNVGKGWVKLLSLSVTCRKWSTQTIFWLKAFKSFTINEWIIFAVRQTSVSLRVSVCPTQPQANKTFIFHNHIGRKTNIYVLTGLYPLWTDMALGS